MRKLYVAIGIIVIVAGVGGAIAWQQLHQSPGAPTSTASNVRPLNYLANPAFMQPDGRPYFTPTFSEPESSNSPYAKNYSYQTSTDNPNVMCSLSFSYVPGSEDEATLFGKYLQPQTDESDLILTSTSGNRYSLPTKSHTQHVDQLELIQRISVTSFSHSKHVVIARACSGTGTVPDEYLQRTEALAKQFQIVEARQ